MSSKTFSRVNEMESIDDTTDKEFSITVAVGSAKFHLIRSHWIGDGDWSFGLIWFEFDPFNHWSLFYVDKLLGDRRLVLLNNEWTF